MPEMTPVESSNIAAVGHDDATGEMFVEFISGGTYAYAGVPYSVAQDLIASPSPGAYLARHIKGRYSYRRA